MLTLRADPRDEIRRRIRLEPESGDAFVAGEEEDLLQVFGGDLGLPFSPESILPTSTTIPQVTSKEILTSRASDAQVTPVAKRVHQTAPPDDSPPLPPPPEGSPPPLPSSPVSQNQPSWPSLPPLMHKRRIPQTRWARYDTDLFHSDRLTAYSGAQPLPLGFLFFKPQHPPRRPPYYASVMPT